MLEHIFWSIIAISITRTQRKGNIDIVQEAGETKHPLVQLRCGSRSPVLRVDDHDVGKGNIPVHLIGRVFVRHNKKTKRRGRHLIVLKKQL